MKIISHICLLFCLVAGLAFGQPQDSKTASSPSANPPKVTIEGLVRDIACPIQNTAATATNFNLQCALDCAKRGSPLIILTKAGRMYFPISSSMPDVDQHQKLMPYIGKYVQVTGTLYEREGTRAIAITEIKELKNVHLVTDAH
ncbi:MAG TPA: hypothetical protein VGR81_08440 [Candidatus Acidoferrales bacterium]|nr:hypothetical protein [Candidatus Acidoferrales bacterium]